MAANELIGEIRKIAEILKSSDTKWDVIEMTQLLILMGFQLNDLDFGTTGFGEVAGDKLEVKFRCASSKISTTLTCNHHECACPKNFNNASSWEVQGTAPHCEKSMLEKSSNLIPDIPKSTKEHVKILLGAAMHLLKVHPDEGANKENVNVKIEVPAENLNTSSTTQILSPSPKQDVFLANIRADNDRDIRIIQQLSEARYKVDQALLMLKFNDRTSMHQNSLLLVTPQKPSAQSSPRIPSSKKLPDVTKIGEKKAPAKLSLLPPRHDSIKRRSIGTISEQIKREPLAPRAPPQDGTNTAGKKKLAVKGNITSNLRRSMTLSQSMPKLPTSAKK